MEYKIIKKENEWDLEKEVSEYLNNGWKCQGGISISLNGYQRGYAQAIIKE